MQSILIAILASYSIAIIVTEYDGPLGVFYSIRRSFLGDLFGCAVCLGVYTSVIFSIGSGFSVIEYFAVVGGVTILARNT